MFYLLITNYIVTDYVFKVSVIPWDVQKYCHTIYKCVKISVLK